MKWFFALIFLLFFVIFDTQVLAESQDLYPFHSAKQATQFNKLLQQLRCLVCQNETIADSDAPIAIDLRREVYQRIQRGESSTVIKRYLTSRYGDFILFKPPLEGATLLLWVGPFFFLLVGVVILLLLVKRYRPQRKT